MEEDRCFPCAQCSGESVRGAARILRRDGVSLLSCEDNTLRCRRGATAGGAG